MAGATMSGPDERTKQEKLADEIKFAKKSLAAAPDQATSDPEAALRSIRFHLSGWLRFVELKQKGLESDLDTSVIDEMVTYAREILAQVMEKIGDRELDARTQKIKEEIDEDIAYYDQIKGNDNSPKKFKPPIDDVYLQTR